MPRVKYQDIRFTRKSEQRIAKANEIIEEYQRQGFDLTLRQLYYQFVSRDLIPNTQKEYKKLGSVINDARLAGLIDWEAIVDRTRHLRALPSWNDPTEILQSAAAGYHRDRWANQPYRPEVWIEKDALVGVFQGVCNEFDVPYFSCRGYTSQSEMWAAGQRLMSYSEHGQTPIILHFGDHDPSGKDMTRDIDDRLELFMGGMKVKRLALNFDQISQYKPPPNPAKMTDARATAYVREFGRQSWELDALEPKVLEGLVRDAIDEIRDEERWDEVVTAEQESKHTLRAVQKHLPKFTAMLRREGLL